MWHEKFEKYRSAGFTVVGMALDAEGIPPAKMYYDKYDITFPSLVDPNYATGFGVVPLTFFVNEHGVVQKLEDWEDRIKPVEQLKPVTAEIRQQWSKPGERLEAGAISQLAARHQANQQDLATTAELASRYLDLKLHSDAATVLKTTVKHYQPKQVAKSGDKEQTRLLAQVYLQLARASKGDRDAQVRYATLSFYLSPTVGFGKQISRIIAPDKFDNRPDGRFDNRFREGTLRRLKKEREEWLAE